MPTLQNLYVSHIENTGPAAQVAASRVHEQPRSWRPPAAEKLCRRNDPLSYDEISMLHPMDSSSTLCIRELIYRKRMKWEDMLGNGWDNVGGILDNNQGLLDNGGHSSVMYVFISFDDDLVDETCIKPLGMEV
jgi:hypothetical protein